MAKGVKIPNEIVKEIINELYENATVFLDRKYDRYLELKKQSI